MVWQDSEHASEIDNFLSKSASIFYHGDIIPRSSCPEVFHKKRVLRNFGKFTGKQTCQSLPFNKVAGLRPAIL